MFEYLNLPSLIISFALGMLYVYAVQPGYEVVYKFPNKYNVKNTVYHDTNHQCFKYDMVEVDCDSTEKTVEQPVVEAMMVKKKKSE